MTRGNRSKVSRASSRNVTRRGLPAPVVLGWAMEEAQREAARGDLMPLDPAIHVIGTAPAATTSDGMIGRANIVVAIVGVDRDMTALTVVTDDAHLTLLLTRESLSRLMALLSDAEDMCGHDNSTKEHP